jgi:DNA gyrase subunit A
MLELMEHVKGPDFPTRGIIMGRRGIRAAYATGKGKVIVRARTETEEFGHDRVRIIVTELPYQVNKRLLIENIADQVRDKRLDGISGLRDESDRNGMRIVIEVKKDANPQVVLNRLFAQTQLQSSFSVNMLALSNEDGKKQPKIFNLRHMLDEYLTFQEEVITRRTEYDRKKALEREHLLQGLLIAQDNIDEVIRIIRSAYDDARERLMARFGLDEVQAQAILDMRLKALQGLDREKLQAEYDELELKIAYYNDLLADPEKIKGVLKDELLEIRDKYGDERKTEIIEAEDDIDIEDLIEQEQCVYTLTNAGYLKRVPASTYKAQHRGGKGIMALTTKEEDFVKTIFTASTHDYIMYFTNYGRVYIKKGYLVPEAGRQAKGTNVVNILPLQPGEKISTMIRMSEHTRDEGNAQRYLVFTTKKGTVKRTAMSELKNIRTSGIRAITLDEDDELISVCNTSGEDWMLLTTKDGMAICFAETDLRAMGRNAAGVRGIRLREGDFCVGAEVYAPGAALLSVTEKGYGKRTAVEEYLRTGDDGASRVPQNRGGMGLKNYNITDKTGPIVAARVVTAEQDLMIIADDGTTIRMGCGDVASYGRATQGVRVMRLSEGAKVISVTPMDRDEEESENAPDPEPDTAE